MNMEARITRMLDENDIRNLTARFANAAMSADYDAFRAVWSDDAHWTIGNPPRVFATGIADILAMLRKLRDSKEFFVQFALQSLIEIDGNEATSQCLCHEAARGPDGSSYYRNHCVAFDRFKKTEKC